jgi:hypothetical protein
MIAGVAVKGSLGITVTFHLHVNDWMGEGDGPRFCMWHVIMAFALLSGGGDREREGEREGEREREREIKIERERGGGVV